MTTARELEQNLWEALRSDRTVMLGLDGVEDGHARPMTAQAEDDPKLALLRLDAEQGEVWLDENSLLAGVKMLMGIDPKQDYKDKVAEVDLR